MKIKTAEFEVSAPDLRSCPNWTLPEFAVIGRSNVGKSSLINSLTERRSLAKVSATPGKTQLINFFRINTNWSLVDLPGYGYAEVGKEKRLKFTQAVSDFLSGRPNLRRVFVLIDSRLPPQAIDIDFFRWLEKAGVDFALIFTKADKQSATATQVSVDAFTKIIAEWRSDPITTFISSAKTGDGRSAILGSIAKDLERKR
ncbi:MAG: ribosome biogenesis GTP-binding protein YihA/YsxC [Verrucomicrobiota bacterium]